MIGLLQAVPVLWEYPGRRDTGQQKDAGHEEVAVAGLDLHNEVGGIIAAKQQDQYQ